MGQKQDAELLPIDNIDYAQRLDVGSEESADPVIHVIKAPGGQLLGPCFLEIPSSTLHLLFMILLD